MARRQILRGLLNNSAAAYYAAIELHNKPNITYRYETTTLLMLNAWELLLKAYVHKNLKQKIFLPDGKTIACRKAIDIAESSMSGSQRAKFSPIAENLRLIEDYRNIFAHYYLSDLDAAIFSLLAKASYEYPRFRKEYFPKSELPDSNLYILPLGFKLPFSPEMMFDRTRISTLSPEAITFFERIASVSTKLEQHHIKDSVLIGFDIHLNSVKKVSNADIVARIDNSGLPLRVEKQIRISNAPNAAPVFICDDEFFQIYPLAFRDFVNLCREKINDFKEGPKFYKINKMYVQNNQQYAGSKSLNRDKTNSRFYYRPEAVQIIAEHWND